jgi:hypothetical protein
VAETTDEIRQHIEGRRTRIAQDINELEHRVRETVDFQEQFRRHTGAMLGSAFGVGLLFGLMTGGARAPEPDHYRDW